METNVRKSFIRTNKLIEYQFQSIQAFRRFFFTSTKRKQIKTTFENIKLENRLSDKIISKINFLAPMKAVFLLFLFDAYYHFNFHSYNQCRCLRSNRSSLTERTNIKILLKIKCSSVAFSGLNSNDYLH